MQKNSSPPSQESFVFYRQPRSTDYYYLKGFEKECGNEIPKNTFVFSDFLGQRYGLEVKAQLKLEESQLKKKFESIDFHDLISNDNSKEATSQSEFESNVEKGITSIKKGELDKVVFSRIKIQKNYISDFHQAFLNLSKAYLETFVCLFYSPNFGLWIGASPEILLQSDEKNVRTVALAGTQQSMGKLPKDAVWSQKEIEEQALVCRYIINCFKKIRLREYDERGPKTILTGRLFHLKTDFLICKNEVRYENLEGQLVELLHPTSAVCGMPKKEAVELILARESHERALYTGFWGPTDEHGVNFYVNIRLAQIFKNQIVFYAGAGITEDSDPHSEWQETEAKCDNLALKLF